MGDGVPVVCIDLVFCRTATPLLLYLLAVFLFPLDQPELRFLPEFAAIPLVDVVDLADMLGILGLCQYIIILKLQSASISVSIWSIYFSIVFTDGSSFEMK